MSLSLAKKKVKGLRTPFDFAQGDSQTELSPRLNEWAGKSVFTI